MVYCSSWSNQTCAASQVKSKSWLDFFSNFQKSQSHDFDFFGNLKKVKSWLWLWLDFLTFFTIFSIFFRYFDLKKGPNCPKVCLKCKILTKWPLGTKRKRQNMFSRRPSKKFKVIFLTFFRISKKVKVMTLTFLFFSKKSSHDLTFGWLDLTFP